MWSNIFLFSNIYQPVRLLVALKWHILQNGGMCKYASRGSAATKMIALVATMNYYHPIHMVIFQMYTQ